MTARGTLAALLLPLALLSACGDDSGPAATDPVGSDSTTATDTASPTESGTPSDTSSPEVDEPKKPQCDDIWVEGKNLPWGYEQCYDGDRRVKANGRYCEIGKPLITYRDNWYATPGGPVNMTDGPLAEDPDYQKSIKACGG